MIIIWGERLMGKVDHVPGLFHVATRFGHLWYIPLIPMGSYIVFGQDGTKFQGVKLGLDIKSIFVAWLRAALWVSVVVSAISVFMLMNDKRGSGVAWVIPGLLCAASGVAIWMSYQMKGIGMAHEKRALALAERAGLNELGMIALGVHFGKLTEMDADVARRRIIEAKMAGSEVEMARSNQA